MLCSVEMATVKKCDFTSGTILTADTMKNQVVDVLKIIPSACTVVSKIPSSENRVKIGGVSVRLHTLPMLHATANKSRRTCRGGGCCRVSTPSHAFLASTAALRTALLRTLPSFRAICGHSAPHATFQARKTPPLATEQCP